MIKEDKHTVLEGGFFTQGDAFEALISQASTYNSYVSGWLFFDYIYIDKPFYMSCCFISDQVDCSVYNFISCLKVYSCKCL